MFAYFKLILFSYEIELFSEKILILSINFFSLMLIYEFLYKWPVF